MKSRNAALVAALVATMTVVSPASPVAVAASGNLIVDGDGEAASCSDSGYDGMTIPGWTVTAGSPNVVCFTNRQGFPNASVSGARPGKGYFTGGPWGNSSMTQTVDAGSTMFNLSGWLGGWSSQNDRAGMTATFLSATGASLGTSTVGPVTATDRLSGTKFLQRSSTGSVPSGTRSIKVVVDFTNTAGQTTDGYADDLSLTLSANVTPKALIPPASTVPGFDHVFFMMFENRDPSEIIGSNNAPYLNGLRSQGALLNNYYALTHVSDPNYIAVWGGSVFGRRTNPYEVDGIAGIDAPHLGTRADSAGKTWKNYALGANGNCDLVDHNPYYWNDVPAPYFLDVQPTWQQQTQRCKDHMQPLSRMETDLQSAATTPNLVWFAPDICSMMHDCAVRSGDDWAKAFFPKIFTSPAWTQQRSLLIVTFDEDGNGKGMPGGFGSGDNNKNKVTTLVLGSPGTVKAGFTSNTRYTHYSSTRTMEQALGLGTLTGNDKYADTFNDIFP